MSRLKQDLAFALVVLALVVAIPFVYDSTESEPAVVNTAGSAYENTEQPAIKLLSPDDGTDTFNARQTFLYRLKSQGLKGTCSLVVDGEEKASERISTGELGRFKTNLAPGYYKWKVTCELDNGNVLSSQSWTATVHSPESMGEVLNEERTREQTTQGNSITGQAVNAPQAAGAGATKAVLIALLMAGALIWAVRFKHK